MQVIVYTAVLKVSKRNRSGIIVYLNALAEYVGVLDVEETMEGSSRIFNIKTSDPNVNGMLKALDVVMT